MIERAAHSVKMMPHFLDGFAHEPPEKSFSASFIQGRRPLNDDENMVVANAVDAFAAAAARTLSLQKVVEKLPTSC
jgi:hypothetical protein